LGRFHRSLAHRPPSGFRGSVSVRIEGAPWLEGVAYEDWYLLEDWSSLGVLEEAAVSRGHAGAHDAVATLVGSETAAVYRLLEGSADPAQAQVAVWVASAPGHERPELAQLLGDGIDPARDGLWQRCLVLGPGPGYCVLASSPEGEAPAGVAATRLPAGWSAVSVERTVVWRA
jgi:hypothetical protein